MLKFSLTPVPEMPEGSVVGVDVETDAEGVLALFQVADKEKVQLVLARDLKRDFVFALFSSKKVLGFNFHFDLAKIAFWFREFLAPADFVDLKTLYHLKFPRKPASLKEVCAAFGLEISKELQKSDWGAQELSDEQLKYAAADAAVLLKLLPKLRDSEDLYPYARLESKFVVTCAYMRWCGIPVSGERVMRLLEKSQKDFATMRVVFVEDGAEREVRHNSHKDVKKMFLEKHGVTLQATNVVSLRKEIVYGRSDSLKADIDLLLRKRSAQKSIQYLKNLQKFSDVKTKRVYPTYNPLVRTATGRSSCKEPNAQNPPGAFTGSEVRTAFFAESDWFYYFDLPNIHARIAAEVSGDEKLLRIFQENLDIHSVTGCGIAKHFGIDARYDNYKEFCRDKEAVDKVRHVRDVAKNVFYGCLNGQGVEGLTHSLVKGKVILDQKTLRQVLHEFALIYPTLHSLIRALGMTKKLKFRDGFEVDVERVPYNDKIAFTWLHYEAVVMKYILNGVFEKFNSHVQICNFMHDSAMFMLCGASEEELTTRVQELYGKVMRWLFKKIPVPTLEIKKVKEMPL